MRLWVSLVVLMVFGWLLLVLLWLAGPAWLGWGTWEQAAAMAASLLVLFLMAVLLLWGAGVALALYGIHRARKGLPGWLRGWQYRVRAWPRYAHVASQRLSAPLIRAYALSAAARRFLILIRHLPRGEVSAQNPREPRS